MNYLSYHIDFLFDRFNDPSYWAYDLETFPNAFTGVFYNISTGEQRIYEISDRVNHLALLLEFLLDCENKNQTFVGFNNVGFDYPILHMIMKFKNNCRLEDIWHRSKEIINTSWKDRRTNVIREPLIRQIDLMKVMRFEKEDSKTLNREESTSLKMLECRMNMQSVKDLPFPPCTVLNNIQYDKLIKYNSHDVQATYWFFNKILPQIKLRSDLTKLYGIDFTNDSNTSIGSKIFIKSLNESGIRCTNNLNTHRDFVNLKDCIPSYTKFKQPEFNRIKNYLESQIITETKGVFKNLTATVDDVKYVYGLGGLHASVKNEVHLENEEMMIQDSDAKSYYPHISFLNGIFPEHLGIKFCSVYKNLYVERSNSEKREAKNEGLKEALNSVFGKTIAKFGAFKDIKCGMSITIGGQMSLCMLAENLLLIPKLKIISVNTDGICYTFPKRQKFQVDNVCRWWEQITNGQELEHVEYSAVYQKDVNNYIAVTSDGKVKRKGCYCYGDDLTWGKDHSMQVVAKSAEEWLLSGSKMNGAIIDHPRLLDFIIHLKVPKNTLLAVGEKIVPNIIRYVVTHDGERLTKVMPAKGIEGEYKRANKLADEYFDRVMAEIGMGVWDERIHTKNKSIYTERRSDINKGYKVTQVTNLRDLHKLKINYDFYINETEKITEKLL